MVLPSAGGPPRARTLFAEGELNAEYFATGYAKDGNDQLSGLAGDATILGGSGRDKLFGDAGNDTLKGRKGSDLLDGGDGRDFLEGGRDGDAFLFDSKLSKHNVDMIADFGNGHDTIQLDDTVFMKLGGPGVLAGKYFAHDQPGDANDRVIYEAATGKIYYDQDGNGPDGMVLFAKLDKGTSLHHDDFLVVEGRRSGRRGPGQPSPIGTAVDRRQCVSAHGRRCLPAVRSGSVVELRVPVGGPALRRDVEHVPQRGKVGGAAGVLTGVGGLAGHLAAPEMADGAVAAGEDVEGRDVRAVRQNAVIVAGVVAVKVAVEFQVLPPALPLPVQEPLDRRAGDHRERDALRDVGGIALEGTEKVGAHRARPLPLRPEHEAVDGERLLVAEQLREAQRPVFALEPVVADHLAAGRQGAPHRGDPLEMAAELDLLDKQRCPRGAVFGALVGKTDRVQAGELGGGDKTVGHRIPHFGWRPSDGRGQALVNTRRGGLTPLRRSRDAGIDIGRRFFARSAVFGVSCRFVSQHYQPAGWSPSPPWNFSLSAAGAVHDEGESTMRSEQTTRHAISGPGMAAISVTLVALLALGAVFWVVAPAAARASVTIAPFADHPENAITIGDDGKLAPVLDACLFKGSEPPPATLSPRGFALRCVVPYINGLWLDPDVLYRSKADVVGEATDRLIEHPAGEPFPIFYPPALHDPIESELKSHLGAGGTVTLRPLPDPLPKPTLDPRSLYNNIGLLYLPNPYVVPGDTFNEMYGWDSFFIVKGLLASVDFIMANPTARVWSPEDKSFQRLSPNPGDPHYCRAFAEKLFDTAKGMVDNHVFEIAYYGGFVLNANRTYYLTRSQPPLFTQEAIAVLASAQKYGFDYKETLTPYLGLTRPGFVAPTSYREWIGTEVLPAAHRYYAYWTDPETTWDGTGTNPRVAEVAYNGATQPVYLYGTDGVGPAPEVARSTQPQNRTLYKDVADGFEKNPATNPDRLFYNPDQVCQANRAIGNCGDPTYHLTQAYYAADRAIRASGFDLSGRFGGAGEWAMNYAPISLNVLLVQMAADIDRLSILVGEPAPFADAPLAARRQFLASFFARAEGGGYGDRFVGAPPPGVPRFAYPYATQLYLLWGDVLADAKDAAALVSQLQANDGGSSFLAPPSAPRFGIPTSLTDTGKQRDAPFAWAPIQYFAVDGLATHAFPVEAATAMEQWIAAVNAFFARTGVLIEKYDSTNPTDDPRVRVGYVQTQRGFGWTNAVYMLFVNRLYQRF